MSVSSKQGTKFVVMCFFLLFIIYAFIVYLIVFLRTDYLCGLPRNGFFYDYKYYYKTKQHSESQRAVKLMPVAHK